MTNEATVMAQKTWNELMRVLRSLDPADAHEKLQIALAEKARLEEGHENSNIGKKVTRIEPDVDNDLLTHESPSFVLGRKIEESENLQELPRPGVQGVGEWLYYVEVLDNIASYSMTIQIPPDRKLSSDSLKLSVAPAVDNSTVVTLLDAEGGDKSLISVRFDDHIQKPVAESGAIRIDRDSICIRLKRDRRQPSNAVIPSATSVSAIKKMECRSCGQRILEQKTISEVFQLPKGCWTEIADHLSCYEGSPSVDFSSCPRSSVPGFAFEDASFVVLHHSDVQTSVCVLAVSGYGAANSHAASSEFSSQGSLPAAASWSDSVGGSTLCCSNCCSILGFVPADTPDTCRILKHRLSSGGKPERDANGPSIFVANEMVRHAESKAIYTFIVQFERTPQTQTGGDTSIVIRLVSWDTALASNFSSWRGSDGVDTPFFQNVVKVIYSCEEAGNEAVLRNTGLRQGWNFGNSDPCCAPNSFIGPELIGSLAAKSDSSAQMFCVRLVLDEREWLEVRRSLDAGASLFSTSMSDAMVRLKLSQNRLNNARLSTMPLSYVAYKNQLTVYSL